MSLRDAILADLPADGSFWEFKESVDPLLDSGGGGHNLTKIGVPDLAQVGPRVGTKAIRFRSAGGVDGLSAGDIFTFSGTQTYSVEFWQVALPQAGAIKYSISKMDTAGFNPGWYFIRDDVNIWWRRAYTDDSKDQCQGTIDLGVWTQWVGTYDGSFMNLYKKGELHVGPVATTASLPAITTPLTIGTWSGLNIPLEGLMAFVAVSPSVVLTPAQVRTHYRAAYADVDRGNANTPLIVPMS